MSAFILAAILLGTSVRVAQKLDVDWENVPEDVINHLADGPFAQTYSIGVWINPFYLRGDFDGDGKPDYAILVLSKKDHSKGIAIWLTSQAKFNVLGAGTPFKLSAGDTADFQWMDIWQVYGKKPVGPGIEAGPPPKLIGEALLVGKRESASGLIYWNAKKFVWYQQGD
jgi:hypothetical protein